MSIILNKKSQFFFFLHFLKHDFCVWLGAECALASNLQMLFPNHADAGIAMPSQWSFHACLHPIISLHVAPCSVYAPNGLPCSALILNLRRRRKGKAAFRWAEVILVRSSDYICMAKVFHSTMAETLWCLLTVSIPDRAPSHHPHAKQTRPKSANSDSLSNTSSSSC